MFFRANPTIGFTLQAVISICIIAYAIFLKRIPKKIHAAIGVMSLIPVAFALFLFIYGNISTADYEEDVIIVLGAGVNRETVSRPLAHRLNAAIDYWNKNPNAIIVTTGGLGNRATITEAEAMARYLIARGVPGLNILQEDLSTSTYENLIYANGIIEKRFPNGYSAVLITNDFHIYRAVRTARQAGIEVNHIGAYTDWYAMPVNYLREMLAVLNHWLFSSE